MRLIVFQKMVTSRWHRKYFSYDVELLISEEKIKYLSMNIPLEVLCSLGSLISHHMFTFKLFLTSLAKNLEAFSCASSIIWIFQRLGRRGLTWAEHSPPPKTQCVSMWKLLIFIVLWPYMLFFYLKEIGSPWNHWKKTSHHLLKCSPDTFSIIAISIHFLCILKFGIGRYYDKILRLRLISFRTWSF